MSDNGTGGNGDGTEATEAGEATEATATTETEPAESQPAETESPNKDKAPVMKGKKQRTRRAKYARRALFTLLGLVGFLVAAFAVAYILTPVPSAKSASTASGPTIYYAGGTKEITHIGVNRQLVSIDQVPTDVQQAVVAAENRTFYSDPGVSVKGTARAVWSTVSGEQVQGGSTITQQMVRNYYSGLSQERSIFRKFKEIMVSLKVGEEKSKSWIMEQYLNTIYFGRQAYGVQAASQAYFGKNVQDLDYSQAAFLAAAIQQPSVFADVDTDKAAKATAVYRWRYVLSGMVAAKTITQQQADKAVFPTLIKVKDTEALGGQTGYIVNEVKAELKAAGYTEEQIETGGLKIETTLDPKLMAAAKQAVQDNIPSNTSSKVYSGLVAEDPKTGEIEAFYGGKDYLKDQNSTVFGGHTAQAGSGFKPYVLAAALNDGDSLLTTEDGSSPQTFAGTSIHNDSDESYGNINLITATEHSVNTAYINLALDVGLDKVEAMAEQMGIPAGEMVKQKDTPSFALGTSSVSVAQQAGGYATFANGGVYVTPHLVSSVTKPNGKKVKLSVSSHRAFSQQVANDATYAMERVVENGTGTNAQLNDGRQVAGKTGTTTNGAALWFNGYVPQMSTSVGVYREDGKAVEIPGFSAYGGSLSATIWHDFMETATAGMTQQDFGDPSIDSGGYDGGGQYQPSTPPTHSAAPRPSTTPSSEPSSSAPPSEQPSEQPSEPPSDAPSTEPPSDGGGGGGGGGGNA